MVYLLDCDDYISAMKYLHKRGFRMPGDIKIMGSDAFDLMWYCPPISCGIVIEVDYEERIVRFPRVEENGTIAGEVQDVQRLREDIVAWESMVAPSKPKRKRREKV